MAEPQDLKEVEALKVELLGAQQTITKLQKRLESIKEENDQFKDKLKENEEKSKQAKEDYDDIITLLKDNVATLTQTKVNLESELSRKSAQLVETQNSSKAKIDKMRADWESDRNNIIEKYKSLEEKYNLIANFEQEQAQFEERIRTLEEELETEKDDKLRSVADKEREKVEATEKLKKEMAAKIQETKSTLLVLKKEQLNVASRLAVIQNHQLTAELEYQNKQVEKMMTKHAKLEEENASLKRDIQIHKEVENEMAKKSCKGQGLIKKLGERVKELETQITEIHYATSADEAESIIHGDKKKDEVIKYLEKSLNAAEKRLAKLQNDYEILLGDFEKLENKLVQERLRYADAATLVRENLEGILEGSDVPQNTLESANIVALDLEEIKGKSIEDLNVLQKQMLMRVILEQIKKHLNERNLTNEFYPVVKGKVEGYGVLVVDKKAYQLPNIYEKSLSHKISKSKFDHSPVGVKSKMLRGGIREWGRSVDLSPNAFKEKIRYKM